MFEKKDHRKLLWSGVALVGAACLGHQAFAGNYDQAVPAMGTPMSYFTVNVPAGSSFVAPGLQVLIDDITYSPSWIASGIAANLTPESAVWPANQLGGPALSLFQFELSNTFTFLNGGIYGTGIPNGGAPVTFDTQFLSYSLGSQFQTQIRDDAPGGPSRVVDQSMTYFHASYFSRQSMIDSAAPGTAPTHEVASGVGISESLATLSESRHFQTPVLIAAGNSVRVFQPFAVQPGFPMTTFIHGRVIYDNAGVVLDDSPNITVTTP
jgi:hypothetical protein